MNNWICIIPAHVLSDKRLSASAKVVYGAISSFTANGTKPAFPSHAQIAERANTSERTISRLVAKLENAGHIKVHPRGHGWNHVYEISTSKCDDIEKSQRNTVPNLNAELSLRSIKRIKKRNSTAFPEQAETLYGYYAKNVRPGLRTATLKSITKLLAQHTLEELMEAVAAYMSSPQWHADRGFRFAAHNFFGKKEYFRDYLNTQAAPSSAELPPKILGPAELEIRRRLLEAGQD